MKNKFIILFCFCLGFSQAQIAAGYAGDNLVGYLQNNYTPDVNLDYGEARDVLYSQIDIANDGRVYGIYTNYSVWLDPNSDPSTHLYENGMNCEHVWPQSQYEGDDPMKADMHILRPAKDNVNSSRGNNPFGEILDNQTNMWFWQDYASSSTPSSNIDQYSESDDDLFEPREDVKGDIARTMFYFYTIYTDVADMTFFLVQKSTLYQWHLDDPATDDESVRTWEIAEYQTTPNPFILDDTLMYRCYFHEVLPNGDVNFDGISNVVDIVYIVSYIMGTGSLTYDQSIASDINEDSSINVVDIVALVDFIISS